MNSGGGRTGDNPPKKKTHRLGRHCRDKKGGERASSYRGERCWSPIEKKGEVVGKV